MKKFIALALIALTFISVQASPPNIKQSYDSQIGVREKTGNNDGPAVKMYLATCNLSEGYAWCAAFVKWNLLNSGFTQAKQINAMAMSCDKEERHVQPTEARTGDVFTLYYVKLKRIGHTGFFDKQINKSIYRSVEGNTNEAGSREGDGVYVKYRSYRATYSFNRWTS